jgi:hypothetical protein
MRMRAAIPVLLETKRNTGRKIKREAKSDWFSGLTILDPQ